MATGITVVLGKFSVRWSATSKRLVWVPWCDSRNHLISRCDTDRVCHFAYIWVFFSIFFWAKRRGNCLFNLPVFVLIFFCSAWNKHIHTYTQTNSADSLCRVLSVQCWIGGRLDTKTCAQPGWFTHMGLLSFYKFSVRFGNEQSRSVWFRVRGCGRDHSMYFSHLRVFLISVKPVTTENTENKTTPKFFKITVVWKHHAVQTCLLVLVRPKQKKNGHLDVYLRLKNKRVYTVLCWYLFCSLTPSVLSVFQSVYQRSIEDCILQATQPPRKRNLSSFV